MTTEKARKLSRDQNFFLHSQGYFPVGQERGVQGGPPFRQDTGGPECVQGTTQSAGKNRFSIFQVKGITTSASTMGNKHSALFLSPRDGQFDLNGLIRKLWSILTGDLVPVLEKIKALGILP